MVALAGDEIIADPSSVVGSIGVVSATFGFQDMIKKIGVERRVYTAGRNKSILDPFRPVEERDLEILHSVQSDIHDTFTESVKERRGAKLADDERLFTGQFWTGRSAVGLGLVDGIGSVREVLKSRYGEKVRVKTIAAQRPSLLRGRLGVAGGLSAEGMIGAVRVDRLYERYGL